MAGVLVFAGHARFVVWKISGLRTFCAGVCGIGAEILWGIFPDDQVMLRGLSKHASPRGEQNFLNKRLIEKIRTYNLNKRFPPMKDSP